MEVVGGVILLILIMGGLWGMWQFFTWLGDKQEEAEDRRRIEAFLMREAIKREIEMRKVQQEADQEAGRERERRIREEYEAYIHRSMNREDLPPKRRGIRPFTFEEWREFFNKY